MRAPFEANAAKEPRAPHRRSWGSAALVALALAALPGGCLPGDTRPVPESLYVTAEPSQALTQGVETSDGWRITFDRFVIAIGNVDFEEDDGPCTSYAEAHYERLFDFTVAGREKVGTIYGLGTCRVGFRLRGPSFDALLGPGATEADRALMQERAADRFAEDERASVLAIGSGARGDEVKRFEWIFRRSYKLTSCASEAGGLSTTVELTEAAASELRLEVRAEELFRSIADDRADLWFQPIADADADADGLVTLDELSIAPRPAVDSGELGPAGSDMAEGPPQSLEHLVYEELLPRVLRVLGGGPCEAEVRGRR
jgi:hypothetical protein